MPKAEFDQIVRTSAALLSEADVSAAAISVSARNEERVWIVHEPLNVLAYEDQRRPGQKMRRTLCGGDGS
jgi:hypothetical protein